MKWFAQSENERGTGRTSSRLRPYLTVCLVLTLLLITCASAGSNPALEKAYIEHNVMPMHNITTAQRMAAAEEAAQQGLVVGKPNEGGAGYGISTIPALGGYPDYFGPYSNYANSQLPTVDVTGNVTPGTGIRKFVDRLPGLGPTAQNNLGQYIPVAVTDTLSYPNTDYYVIGLVEYSEKMHSDITPTLLRGYVQLNTPNITAGANYPLLYPNGTAISYQGIPVIAHDKPHYLGPLIVAQKDRPVRFKFINLLPNGAGGDLFIPVDTTLMGAGAGPNGSVYTENRATIHLHGGNTPWISDGTPHQWTTPANENTPYPTGVSTRYVPDMDGGVEPAGTMTFYYTNQQSARLMFYHDHALGITRLNVYAGEAAGYLLQDPAEKSLQANGAIPNDTYQIPLIIQDKTFVPSLAQLNVTDPTWNWGNTSTPWPHTGSLWYPHVYMPLQKNLLTVNPMGRWDYGPWVLPPSAAQVFTFQPIPNPYYDPVNAPWEPPLMPATPNPSTMPEAFMDTPVVNGAAYPYLEVGPHAYRFTILNAANDRTLNLQLYKAASNATMWSGTTLLNGSSGEVPMVPANATLTPGLPPSWPTDDRPEGVPDPAARGPSWIQIGTEGGILPAPVVIPPQPVVYDTVNTAFGVINIANKSLLLLPAQRADVIVDFTGIPGGTKLILYNDAPAPAPGGDTRYDYFTNDTNQTVIGGAPTTFAGYGPNTRTIMQIQINASIPGSGINLATLNAQLPVAYAQTQEKPLVAESAYNTAFGWTYPDQYVNLTATNFTFIPAGQIAAVTMGIQPKSIWGDFEMVYGRLTALLGTKQASAYIDPPTEVFNQSLTATLIGSLGDGTQIWRIANNDVDSHPVHWHMFDLQVLNRVRWDGVVLPPDPNELGWRETITTPPLMDTIVAMRPIIPIIPWEIPNAIRPLDVTRALGSTQGFTGLDPTGGQAPVVNHIINFGWEYVFHCHILGHEENDFMHPMAVAVAPKVPPSGLTVTNISPTSVNLTWVDTTVSETNWTVQRALNAPAGPWTHLAMIASTTGPQKGGTVSYIDATRIANTAYYYRVLATNIVGDNTVYPGAAGYPYLIVNSSPSNTAPSIVANISKIGVFRPSTHIYYQDFNGNGAWNGASIDRSYNFGITGDLPVSGDWNNNGISEIGVFRPSTHIYYQDFNGNGVWNGAVIDRAYNFGITGDLPVSGDWNNDRISEIGVFRPSTHIYYQDFNGDSVWNGAVIDRAYNFGITEDLPVSGDWNNDGISEIGVFRNSTHLFYLDYNGNGVWNGAKVDRSYNFGITGDIPITGDWNNDGIS